MKAGDKVVCVDDAPRPNPCRFIRSTPGGKVKKGQVYVVSCVLPSGTVNPETTKDGSYCRTKAGAIRLTILGHPVLTAFNADIGWWANRFRPVSEFGHPPIAIEIPSLLDLVPLNIQPRKIALYFSPFGTGLIS